MASNVTAPTREYPVIDTVEALPVSYTHLTLPTTDVV